MLVMEMHSLLKCLSLPTCFCSVSLSSILIPSSHLCLVLLAAIFLPVNKICLILTELDNCNKLLQFVISNAVLLQNAVQTSWPGNRQMVVPSWQQIPPQHAAIQQPLLSDAGDWGRPLIVDSSTILQEHRPVFPVDVAAEVYDPSLVDHHSNHHSSATVVNASGSWTNKRGVSKNLHHQHSLTGPPEQQQTSQATHHHHHHHHHHLTVPSHRSQQDAKKEPTQLSPVKKRVKEGTPPTGLLAL